MNASSLNPFGGGASGAGGLAASQFAAKPAGTALSSEARSALKTLDLKAMIGGTSSLVAESASSLAIENDGEETAAASSLTNLQSGANAAPMLPQVDLAGSSTAEAKAFQDWLAKHGLQHAVDSLQVHSFPYENMKKDGSGVVLTVGRLPPCVPAL